MEDRRIRRRVDRLQRKPDVAAHNFLGRAVHPRRFHTNAAPEFVQPPQIGRQPAPAGFQHHHFQVRMPREDALDDQAGQLGLERLRLGDVILDVIGTPADRGRRVVVGAAGMDADRQAMLLSRGVDRPVGAFAERHVTHHKHQHLDEARIFRTALDLRHRLLDALYGYHDRAAQPRFLVEPFLDQPVVERAAECIRHVLGKHHLHAVQGIADALADAEAVERLRLHVPKTGSRLALRRPPVRPRRDRRIGRIGLRYEVRHAPRRHLVAPVIVEVGQQAGQMRNGRMQIAIHAARER